MDSIPIGTPPPPQENSSRGSDRAETVGRQYQGTVTPPWARGPCTGTLQQRQNLAEKAPASTKTGFQMVRHTDVVALTLAMTSRPAKLGRLASVTSSVRRRRCTLWREAHSHAATGIGWMLKRWRPAPPSGSLQWKTRERARQLSASITWSAQGASWEPRWRNPAERVTKTAGQIWVLPD